MDAPRSDGGFWEVHGEKDFSDARHGQQLSRQATAPTAATARPHSGASPDSRGGLVSACSSVRRCASRLEGGRDGCVCDASGGSSSDADRRDIPWTGEAHLAWGGEIVGGNKQYAGFTNGSSNRARWRRYEKRGVGMETITRAMSPLLRFWCQTARASGDKCWNWIGHTTRGYGMIGVNGKQRHAHRFSYERFVGPIPSGMVVCHRCDNRRCVNPRHLFVGTQKDNLGDCADKGRLGSSMRPKLTREQVQEIRKEYTPSGRGNHLPKDRSLDAFAKRYGVSPGTISSVVSRKSWAWL